MCLDGNIYRYDRRLHHIRNILATDLTLVGIIHTHDLEATGKRGVVLRLLPKPGGLGVIDRISLVRRHLAVEYLRLQSVEIIKQLIHIACGVYLSAGGGHRMTEAVRGPGGDEILYPRHKGLQRLEARIGFRYADHLRYRYYGGAANGCGQRCAALIGNLKIILVIVILKTVISCGIKRLCTKHLEHHERVGLVTSESGGFQVLTPLGMVEITVVLVLKALCEADKLLLHILGISRDGIGVTGKESVLADTAKYLGGGLDIGQECIVISCTL